MTQSNVAEQEAMERLHAALANEFATILEKGVTAIDKETGEVVRLTPSAAYLSVLTKFLKDNGINSVASGANSPVKQFAGLPFAEADEED